MFSYCLFVPVHTRVWRVSLQIYLFKAKFVLATNFQTNCIHDFCFAYEIQKELVVYSGTLFKREHRMLNDLFFTHIKNFAWKHNA